MRAKRGRGRAREKGGRERERVGGRESQWVSFVGQQETEIWICRVLSIGII